MNMSSINLSQSFGFLVVVSRFSYSRYFLKSWHGGSKLVLIAVLVFLMEFRIQSVSLLVLV